MPLSERWQCASDADYSRTNGGKIWVNHMCNWPIYIRDHPEDLGARMLSYALEEIDRLCTSGIKRQSWEARLLFAYVRTWDRLRRLKLTWLMVKVSQPDKPMSPKGAFKSIELLNAWRAENPDRGEP